MKKQSLSHICTVSVAGAKSQQICFPASSKDVLDALQLITAPTNVNGIIGRRDTNCSAVIKMGNRAFLCFPTISNR